MIESVKILKITIEIIESPKKSKQLECLSVKAKIDCFQFLDTESRHKNTMRNDNFRSFGTEYISYIILHLRISYLTDLSYCSAFLDFKTTEKERGGSSRAKKIGKKQQGQNYSQRETSSIHLLKIIKSEEKSRLEEKTGDQQYKAQ